jgi:hypothetical protein
MGDIPDPMGSDSEEVALALEVARAQWTKRDAVDALKWLRKAADAAFDAGADQRGMELSKAFADLNNEVKRRAQAEKVEAAPRSLRGKATEPAQRSMAPVSKRGKGFAGAERPTGGRRATSLKPGGKATPPAETTKAAATGARWQPERPTATSPGSENKPAEPQAAKGTKPTDRPGPPDTTVHATQAIRVAVARAPNGRVTVRLLEGKGVFLGEHEAILVGLTRGDDLASLFKSG